MAGNGDDAGVLGRSWGLMTAKYRCSVGYSVLSQVEKQTHRRCRSEKSRPGSHFSNFFDRRCGSEKSRPGSHFSNFFVRRKLGYIYLIAISV